MVLINKQLLIEPISLTLSWWRPLSYRNQSIDLLCKSMDWFLYDNGLRHEIINKAILKSTLWQAIKKSFAIWGSMLKIMGTCTNYSITFKIQYSFFLISTFSRKHRILHLFATVSFSVAISCVYVSNSLTAPCISES